MAAQMRRRLCNRNDAAALVPAAFTAYILCNQAAFIAATLTATLADEKPPQTQAVSPSCQTQRNGVRSQAPASGSHRRGARGASALVTPDTAGKHSRGCLFLKHTSTNAPKCRNAKKGKQLAP